ncbi:MAG: hypothetical protein AB7E24_12005 [Novosphingobium sp.]
MGWIGAIIIWLACAALAETIARSKGRSGCAWSLAGLLFGPIGVLAAAVMPPDEDGIDRRAVAEGKKRHCIYCAEVIRHDATICRYCGRENDPIPAPTLYEKLFRLLIW